MDNEERRKWGVPEPLYVGPAEPFEDLHDGKGTTWVKDPLRGYWPDCCDLHRPAEIVEARKAEMAKREQAERDLARHRGKPNLQPLPSPGIPAQPTEEDRHGYVVGAKLRQPPPVSDERGRRLFARYVAGLLRQKREQDDDGEPWER